MGRRFALMLSATISAAVLASFAALAAGAQTASSQQDASADPAQEESTTTPERSSDTAEPEASAADGSPSQGTFTEGRAGPNEPSLVDDTPPSAAERGEPLVTARGRGSGNDVVRAARRYIGTKYRYATCTRSRMSCTCLVKKVFARFGHKLPMSEAGQWKHRPSKKVRKSKLRPGDIVFFKEGGRKRGITHTGIYSGKGNLVHASGYFGKVVESKMKYIKGYSGAKRLRTK
jgi:cell wall-associated NlpC family hydrolase